MGISDSFYENNKVSVKWGQLQVCGDGHRALPHYHYLRECELNAALAETHADLTAGRAVQESPEAHMARLGTL